MNKVMNKKIGKVTGRAFLALFVLVLAVVSNVNALAEFSVSVSPTSYEVDWSTTQTIIAKVHCSNSLQACKCNSYVGPVDSTYFNEGTRLVEISPGSDDYRYLTFGQPATPSSGKGSGSYTYYVTCNEFWDTTLVSKLATFTVSWPTAQKWTQYSTAESSKTSASNALSAANIEISNAQSKINEASGIGADVSSATQYFTLAQSDYTSANTLLSSGNSAYAAKDYSGAASYYTQAQSKANSAQTNAANAKSAANTAIQTKQQAKTQADSAKTSASNALSSANTAINSAQSKITEASNIGADVSSATQYINSAQSDYSSANTLLSSGNTAYTNKDYPSATSYYTQAQSKADSAQTNAASAKSAVDKLLEEYNKKQTQAQNKVSDANSAIDTAKLRIGAADKVISDATVIGLDTAQAKADVATARSKIDTAGAYYKEASNMFSAKNFGSAESKAQSAINLADEAEKLATTAYTRLNERLAVSGESSKAILNANTEVSQMNEILTKMDYIVRSTEKWGVGLAETKAVVSAAKTNVDSAEDLLSQAKNRQASGSFNDAVGFGNQARDKAASSKNRLDTMAQTVSVSVQDSLEKAHSRLKAKITEAETEVQSAQNTYGATPSLIVDAQTDVSSAKNALAQAEKEIEAVASASELMPLLSKAEQAFKSLDATEQKTASAVANAKNAKQGLTKKLAIGAAVAAGAAGGGFLYYRYRQRKKDGKKSEHKTEEKETKKENKDEKETISSEAATAEVKKEETKKEHKEEKKHEKPPKKCPQCSAKLKKGQKFCNKCGKQIMTGGV